MTVKIDAVLFDKDGTLFEFEATWGEWVRAVLADLSAGDDRLASRLAQAVGFDLSSKVFARDSLVIAGTGDEVITAWHNVLGTVSVVEIQGVCQRHESALPLVPCCDLAAMTMQLRSAEFALGVATNDYQRIAMSHLSEAGLDGVFDSVIGCDSGFGAKPDPGMLLGFCAQVGVEPAAAVMVGDSTRDLQAARNAGFGASIGVLTGPACAGELSPLADAVLESVEQVPAWLAEQAIRSGQ